MAPPLRIGLTTRLMYPDPSRSLLSSKTVHYSEENAANWLMADGAAVLIIPRLGDAARRSPRAVRPGDYVEVLDGLVLQGGSDVAPSSYGEEPLDPAWAGDPARDRYEIELLRAFVRQGKPVLGICRGCQLINVAFGGTLYQDIATELPNSGRHRDDPLYERNVHDATILPGTGLSSVYGGARGARINSIHHQAIKSLGTGLVVEAFSQPDRVVEAVRWSGPAYVLGVQWHPEFIVPGGDGLLDSAPLRADFLAACSRHRDRANASSAAPATAP